MKDRRFKGWFVVSVTDDGPHRIHGTLTFPTYGAAKAAADKWLADHGDGNVACICQAVENRWKDPTICILSDAPASA